MFFDQSHCMRAQSPNTVLTVMANHGAECETKCSYDVFLSFRGKDTRHTFTGHLYNALDQKGIITFMDNEELRGGEQIKPTLAKAIEESSSSIVVFSENYADSPWCLNELVKIRECMVNKHQLVIPIFYGVEPSDVRHQKQSYGEAMTKHESRSNLEDVDKWRSTLSEVANLSGKSFNLGRDESKLIEDVVSEIFMRVSPKDLARNELIVGRGYRVEELKSLLEIESRNITCMLGIHGTGGIGKTSLAKALFDSIYKKFEGSCFLSNVRETSTQFQGLRHLQQELLSKTLENNKFQLGRNDEISRTIQFRLSSKRVLIVLDDVDNIEQLNNLAGGSERNWFGPGSRIIITTRDTQLLDLGKVEKKYEVSVLNDQESLELICHKAFNKSYPESNYEELTHRAMRCCKGLPLALNVLGSHLVGKDLEGWKDALDRYEKSPHQTVQRVLEISYESLPPNEKNIFLDIACFFKGHRLEYVRTVLGACDFHSRDGITTLVNKSLLTVNHDCLEMHDLIQYMGREIVKKEAWNAVGERSRLWFYDDVLRVLVDNNGSGKIQGIMLDPPQREEINCSHTVFEKMKNLRILIVRNTSFLNEPRYLPNNLRLLDWRNYPSQSFPSDFSPRKIAAFNLRGSALVMKSFQTFVNLTYINLSYCHTVTEFPSVSGAKNLRELRLDGCEKLVKVDRSVGYLPNLVYLSASKCTGLQSFVPAIQLPCLEYLSLNLCRRLAHFPEIKGKMDKLLRILMTDTSIQELPESVEKATGLKYLEMTTCMKLQDLPSSLLRLSSLATLKIGGCYRLRESFRRFEGTGQKLKTLETLHFDNVALSDEDLHAIIHSFPKLKDLNVSGNNFVSLPTGIKESTNLTNLDVSYCRKLREIPELPSSIQKVDARHCKSLNCEASNMLWSQVRKNMNGLQIKMPKREIPEWFNHVNKGGFPVFKARGRFPVLALAFVFGEVKDSAAKGPLPVDWNDVGVHTLIEDERRQYHNFTLAENHVLLCDLRVLLSLDWEGLDVGVGLGNEWKTIRVCFETELTLCSWGVYVTNLEDVQFVSADSSSSLVWRISEEEKVRNKKRGLTLPERYRGFQRHVRRVEESGYSKDMSSEYFENNRQLLLVLAKLTDRIRAQEEGEGTSGLNIEDEEDKEADLMLEWMIETMNSHGNEEEVMGQGEGEGTSGLNIEDEEDKEADSMLEWIIAKKTSGHGNEEEDSSSECH